MIFVAKESLAFVLAAIIVVGVCVVVSLTKAEVREAIVVDPMRFVFYFGGVGTVAVVTFQILFGIPATIARVREIARVCREHDLTTKQLSNMSKEQLIQVGFKRRF